ncbi:MAG: DNA topoisomerase [Myxococcales bacterium]|nr:DNA topoisomerase [Myxococcales bacterium]|tara:strand:+ start:2605 stop:4989 length:2385 start_codon:yes stop_codon:yes gene_type:complete
MDTDLFSSDGEGAGGLIEPTDLYQATRHRYLNYALSVITSRALPDVRDGLKPVQRRILYGMYKDLKLRADTRFLKSARVVGEVMGKYHPHGDQSIYDAMVRMAQSFSLRYPLVDGQGNFGSIDGDGAAAMRYTEARLQSLAEELLAEIGEGTTLFRTTYDGQLSEPITLPAQVPNLLINGASGIAVGMATNIPPHNLSEVIDALVSMIDDPLVDSDTVCRHVRGPDFPTGGEILSSAEELKTIYTTGQGPVKLRGTYEIEVINRKKCVIIDSIPYGVNKSTLIEKIAGHIINRNVPQIVDVRDESTDDIRIVLELKRGAEPKVAMAYLYKNTPLQQNFHVNLTCLVPSDVPEVTAPARLSLLEVLRHFLDFRMEVVTRRLRHQLGKLETAIHRLEGFEIIFDALDELIALIRASEGKADAARKIMLRFDLDEEQTDAILELKLYRLAKLEILLIQKELDEKRRDADRIRGLLASEFARWSLVRSELLEVREAYGDPRRTRITGPTEEQSFDPEAYIVRERTWVIVSRQGRIKRQKGFSDVAAIRVPDGDEVGWVVRTDTTHTVTLYTQYGSAYSLRVDDIGATTGYGEPVQSAFNFKDGERIIGVTTSDPKVVRVCEEADALLADDDPKPPFAIALSRDGKATRFTISAHFDVSTKNGRRFMSLGKSDEVLAVFVSSGDEHVALATVKGRAMLFRVDEIPPKATAIRGVNAIKLASGDQILGFTLTVKKRQGLTVRTSRGRELIVRETSYKPVKRGAKGAVVLQVGSLTQCEWPLQILQPPSEEDETEVDEVIE